MSIWSRFRNRWRERPLSAEFDEEIAFHLEQRTERNLREGMDPESARLEARRYFGNMTLAREDMRAARMTVWLDSVTGDLRYGVRVFSRQPVLTGIAVLTLALGIGANAAIFSVLNAVLFRPFPFPAADRMVLVVERVRSGGGTSPTIPEILDIRGRSRTLEAVSFFDTRDFQIDGGTEPARVSGARVDPAFLALVGATPALGRLLTDADSAEGSDRVLLLGDGFWRRNFGADPGVVGRALAVNGTLHIIAGVLSPSFSLSFLSGEPEIYVPYPLTPEYTLRSGEFANVRRVETVGRLRAGVSLAGASTDLSSVSDGLAAEHPQLYAEFGGARNVFMDVEPLREAIGEAGRRPLLMLFGAVMLVLLIACVNAAQFLLSHAIEREAEVALRSALGAGRARLVRQFLSETLLLVCGAGVLAVALAFWLVRGLRAVFPPMLMVGRIELDVPVLAFMALLALGSTILCGLVPSLRFSRGHLRSAFDARGTTTRRGRARQILIAVEVALSVLLLVPAGQLMRSLQVLQRSQAGFSPESVTAMHVRGMGAGPGLGKAYQQYLDRIADVPGLGVAAVTSAPVPGSPGTPFEIVGRSEAEAVRARQSASYQIVSPGYFAVLEIPLRAGRTFVPTDTDTSTPVAIVNEEMARQAWPGESPIARQIRAGSGPRAATMTVVGVVGNVTPMFQTGDVPQIYVSYLQQAEPNMLVLVRALRGGVVKVDAVKRAIWLVEPRQAVFDIRALDDMLAEGVRGARVVIVLLGGLATLAVVMSIAGIFAVVSYLTSTRLKEIALRRAIGARHSDVIWLLSGQTFGWTLVGLAIGAAGAILASTTLRAMAVGIVALDAPLVAGTGGMYLVVVAVAMVVPAIRALRVDLASALRSE